VPTVDCGPSRTLDQRTKMDLIIIFSHIRATFSLWSSCWLHDNNQKRRVKRLNDDALSENKDVGKKEREGHFKKKDKKKKSSLKAVWWWWQGGTTRTDRRV
jgi:hypothetical protein